MERSEVDYWLRRDALSLREAILLLEDKDPNCIEPPYSKQYYEIESLAISSNRANRLLTLTGVPLKKTTFTIYPPKRNPFLRGRDELWRSPDVEVITKPKEKIDKQGDNPNIDPFVFARWAESKWFSIGEFYKEYISINERRLDSLVDDTCIVDSSAETTAEKHSIEATNLEITDKQDEIFSPVPQWEAEMNRTYAVTPERWTLLKILYGAYIEEWNTERIANFVNISKGSVSRKLREAKEFAYHDPAGPHLPQLPVPKKRRKKTMR